MGFYCGQLSPCGCSNTESQKMGSFDRVNRRGRLKTYLEVDKIVILAKKSVFFSCIRQIKSVLLDIQGKSKYTTFDRSLLKNILSDHHYFSVVTDVITPEK